MRPPYRRFIPAAVLLGALGLLSCSTNAALRQIENLPAQITNDSRHRALLGRLEDKSGAPLGGVLIELHTWNGEMVGSVVTGTDGNFRFDGAAFGQYIVQGTTGRESFSETLNFNGSPVPIEVRTNDRPMTRRTELPSGNAAANRVSVNDLEAPSGARKKLEKAAQAFQEKKLDKALHLADDALKLAPRWGRAWLLRGFIHQQTNDLTAAHQDFQAATRADPGNGVALAALGSSYTRARDWTRADFYLERAISVAPDQWQGWFELSRLQLLEGKYAAAASSARRALDITPPAPAGGHYFLATAEAALGHYANAAREFQLFLASNPPPSRAANDAAHKLQLLRARGIGSAQPAAQPAGKP